MAEPGPYRNQDGFCIAAVAMLSTNVYVVVRLYDDQEDETEDGPVSLVILLLNFVEISDDLYRAAVFFFNLN